MYKKYCNDLINCPFCAKNVNLYYSKSHLKTNKCKELQQLIDKQEYNSLYLIFIKKINELKSDINLS